MLPTMLDKQFIGRLPTKRLLLMLGNHQARIEAWLEMDPAHGPAGVAGFSPFDEDAVTQCAASTLGERIHELDERLSAIERQASDARRR
jgi:hypothetical protein